MISNSPNEEVTERVRKDIVAFADSRTIVESDGRVVRWIQRRVQRELVLVPPYVDGIPQRVVFENKQFDYRQFFASEHMANVLWLSEEIVRSINELPASLDACFLPPQVRLDGDIETTGAGSAAEEFETCLTRICAPSAQQARTNLVFLQGRAGDGKSTALIHSAKQQSRKYSEGASDWLFLYIDAQGRALARLDEAVALILDDLNATFRYHALAVLVRLGIIVPIIDGFDELLGSGGYEDAFSSLESFLLRLDGQGSVVTSARSTFYQFSALSRAASRLMSEKSTIDVQVHGIQLLPWGQEQTSNYLRQRNVTGALSILDENASNQSVYDAAATRIGAGAEEILSTPFLLDRFVDYLHDETHEQGHSIIVSAIRSLIRRELVEKILHPEKGQLLSETQFEVLFGAIAEEMWWQETRAIDEETLLTVAEITFDSLGLSKALSRVLLGKLTSNAVIRIGEGTRKFSFRHEIYFSYFLAKLFVGTILRGSSKDVATLFSRAIVPATLGREVASALPISSVTEYLDKLSALSVEGLSADIVRLNKGYMAAGIVKEHGEMTAPFMFRGMHFEACDFKDTVLTNAAFHNCRLEHLDLSGCKWTNIDFDNSEVNLPLISDTTRISCTGLTAGENLVGVRFRDTTTGADRTVYKLSEVRNLLETVGLSGVLQASAEPPFSDSQKVFIDRLRSLLRVAARSIYFSDQDLQTHGQTMANVRDILSLGARLGLWIPSDKQRGGRRTLYKLCFPPEEILKGEAGKYSDSSIRAFWDYVRTSV